MLRRGKREKCCDDLGILGNGRIRQAESNRRTQENGPNERGDRLGFRKTKRDCCFKIDGLGMDQGGFSDFENFLGFLGMEGKSWQLEKNKRKLRKHDELLKSTQ